MDISKGVHWSAIYQRLAVDFSISFIYIIILSSMASRWPGSHPHQFQIRPQPEQFFRRDFPVVVDERWVHLAPLVLLRRVVLDFLYDFPGRIACACNIDVEDEEAKKGDGNDTHCYWADYDHHCWVHLIPSIRNSEDDNVDKESQNRQHYSS